RFERPDYRPFHNFVSEVPPSYPDPTAGGQLFTLPPSTAMDWPVTKSLSADAREISAPSRAWGCSSRWGGLDWARGLRAAPTWPGCWLNTGCLHVEPGARVFTGMPCSPSSRASARVNAMLPPLLVP